MMRASGITAHSLADIYGEEEAQKAQDPRWIAHAGQQGWIALTKDKHIRHRTDERDAVLAARIHLFALAAGNLGFAATAQAFVAALPRMTLIGDDEPGGVIWVVHRDGRVVRQWP